MKNAAKTLGLWLEEESSFDWRIVLQFGELYFDFSGFIKIVHGILLCCVLPSKHDFNEVAPVGFTCKALFPQWPYTYLIWTVPESCQEKWWPNRGRARASSAPSAPRASPDICAATSPSHCGPCPWPTSPLSLGWTCLGPVARDRAESRGLSRRWVRRFSCQYF